MNFSKKTIYFVIALLIIVGGIFIYKNQITKDQVNDQILETENNKDLPELIDLGTENCFYCKKLEPIMEELIEEYKGKLVIKIIDVNNEKELTLEYHKKHPIRVVPTLILYDKKDNEIWSHEGYMEKDELKKVINDKLGVK